MHKQAGMRTDQERTQLTTQTAVKKKQNDRQSER